MKSKLIDGRQSGILADRYFDVLMGDFKNISLMMMQAIFLAGLIALVWNNIGRATNTLYFVMVLTAIWLGCINACREIVKEQAIFFRERMVNLNVGAYVFSKIRILAMIDFVQTFLLLGIVHYYIHLGNSKLFLMFITLYLCMLSATVLGLLLSVVTGKESTSVGLVPVVIIPQILLSELILAKKFQSGITEILEKWMLLRWGYDSFVQITAKSINYLLVFRDLFILIAFGVGLFFLTILLLHLKPNRL